LVLLVLWQDGVEFSLNQGELIKDEVLLSLNVWELLNVALVLPHDGCALGLDLLDCFNLFQKLELITLQLLGTLLEFLFVPYNLIIPFLANYV